jgi:hypothetical protein
LLTTSPALSRRDNITPRDCPPPCRASFRQIATASRGGSLGSLNQTNVCYRTFGMNKSQGIYMCFAQPTRLSPDDHLSFASRTARAIAKAQYAAPISTGLRGDASPQYHRSPQLDYYTDLLKARQPSQPVSASGVHVRLTTLTLNCGPPDDAQFRAARRLRRVENGLASGATPVAPESPQAARPPGTATADRQFLRQVGPR